jgi:YgiT-type zinc finger domain-containing protein
MKKTVERSRARKADSVDGSLRVCSFCGQPAARESLRPQAFGQGERLLVIENVPTVVCGNCGETYFTGATIDELERILGNQASVAILRPVQVAEFTARAA